MMQSPLILSVSQLNRYVKSQLDADEKLWNVYLVGEISNFTNHYKTGHFYFSLKDEGCQIKAVMFRSSAVKVKFRPENGMRVIVRGRVSLYEAAGSYQIFVDDMQPDGAGALNLAFEQLKEKLNEEGLFSAAHKRPLPQYPERIGVITAETGAAVQDIFNILNRRFPLATVVLAPVLVQGSDAPKQLVRALQEMNEKQAADVIIIGRGGGSTEDLWAFNDEQLARAVYASKIPVISAVGHETDFTICDMVADLRAPTPSAAAELAVPNQVELVTVLRTFQVKIRRAARQKVETEQANLAQWTKRTVLAQPDRLLDAHRMRVLAVSSAFEAKERALLQNCRLQLQENAAKLQALSPLSVLARGYAVAAKEDGRVIHDAAQLTEQEKISVTFENGKAVCRVEEIL